MKRKSLFKLGDVQLELMKIIWAQGKATVRQVTDAMARKRRLAYSTVLTMLRDLERKGILVHDVDGRTYVYRPTVSRKWVTTGVIKDIKKRLFGNSAEALVLHLLEIEKLAPDELEHMKQMIAEKEKEAGGPEA